VVVNPLQDEFISANHAMMRWRVEDSLRDCMSKNIIMLLCMRVREVELTEVWTTIQHYNFCEDSSSRCGSSTICAKPGYGGRLSLYFSSRVLLVNKKGDVSVPIDKISPSKMRHNNYFIHLLGHESSTEEVAPRKRPHALLRPSEANKHVRV